jgi:hypothetical protein
VAALINAAIFSVAFLAYFAVVTAAQASPYLDEWVAILVVGIFGFFLWKALSPFRRLTRMVGGSYNPARQVSKSWHDDRRHTQQFGQAALSGGAAAAGGPYALAGTVAARSFAKRNTVGPDAAPEPKAPAQTPDTNPAPAPPRRVRYPEADRPVPWRPEVEPAQKIATGQSGGFHRAPSYTDKNGQQVWLVYDPRSGKVDEERVFRPLRDKAPV